MADIRKPDKALLILGLLCADDTVMCHAEKTLNRTFGPFLHMSAVYPFRHTTYYNDELGDTIKRKYYSFNKLIKKDTLARIKGKTNSIEKRFSREGKRCVNIDPGYLDLSKIVLASTKEFSHRIYLGQGIYAEVTLLYQKGTYTTLPWTYPDYKADETIGFFNNARKDYHGLLKKKSK